MRALTFMELAILGMIFQKPRTGYDIRKEFKSNPVGSFSGSPGAVYPSLRKLKSLQWITGKIDNRNTLKPKEVFKLTPQGKTTIKTHLLKPITREDVIWHMDDIMLRFVFAEEVVGLKNSLNIVQSIQEQAKILHKKMKEYSREASARVPLTAQLALKNAVESYRQTQIWAKNAVAEINNQLKGN